MKTKTSTNSHSHPVTEGNNTLRLNNLGAIPKLKGFSIASLNIVSLLSHIEDLRVIMINEPFDILAINESRLDETVTDNEVYLTGYTIIRKDRNRQGGGVALYIRSAINYTRRTDLEDEELEFLCTEIRKPKTKPILIGTWYRPPSSSIELFDKLEKILNKIDDTNLETSLIGDLNCNVAASSPDSNTTRLLELCSLYQYTQLIRQHTRITYNSSTTIDLFITNEPLKYSVSGVCHLGISDHSLIYSLRKLYVPKNRPIIVESRQFKKFNSKAFREDLRRASAHMDITTYDDPNEAWECWKKSFLEISDKYAPIRRRKIRKRYAPWLTPDLKRLMFERDRAKRIADIKKDDTAAWTNYKTIKNSINSKIKRSKTDYYCSLFKNKEGQTKKTWNGINQLLGKQPKRSGINSVEINGTTHNEPREIANAFNDHFSNIGPKLASKIPTTGVDFSNYMPDKPNCSFSLRETTPEDVCNLIRKMPSNKSSGMDGVSARLLKEAAPIVSGSLAAIINMSITKGIFPNDWKQAKISPIHKEGPKTDPNNYRPISILSTVSKIIEKIIFKQVYDHLNSNGILNKFQSGFRPLHSTVTALLDATNNWYLNIDDGQINAVLFLDLKKAFDTVNHTILLKKLKHYGIDNTTLKWFESYLSDRKQVTTIENSTSHHCHIKCGVPQGSILGPLLFLIYINDLPNCKLEAKPRLYADDSNLTYSAKNIKEVQTMINEDLKEVHTWLKANKLTLNISKTKYMLMATRQKLSSIPSEPTIMVNSEKILRVDKYKCLGVTLDETLSWDKHIEEIFKKVSKGLGALKRIRPYVPQSTLVTVYNTLILPYFDYCSTVWGCIGKCLGDRLQKLQNRAARIITRSTYEDRSTDILQKLGWNTLEQRREKQLATTVYKVINNHTPLYLQTCFTKTSTIHRHNLRNSGLSIPQPKTEAMKKSFCYRGAVLWNNIPKSIRNANSIAKFCNEIDV